jgi:hypothetical protein
MKDKKRRQRLFSALLVGLVLALLAVGVALAAGNISNTDKWAWGTNAGWINFNPDNGGVTVYPDHLEGFAWGENVGWIRLGTHTGGSPHTYGNTSNTDYGVNRDTTSGALSGYAWSTNAGWINFAPANGGVTVSPAGEFSGYAWGENIGWINFNGTAADNTPYKVATAGPLAVTLASFDAQGQADRVVVTWETVSELDNAGFNLYRTGSVGDWEPSRRDRPEPSDLLAYVPSQAPGSTQGAAYSYEDLAVQPGETWWYWLEDVSLGGATTLHGPVSATVQTPTAVTLAQLDASSGLASPAGWLLALLAGLLAVSAAGWLARRVMKP